MTYVLMILYHGFQEKGQVVFTIKTRAMKSTCRILNCKYKKKNPVYRNHPQNRNFSVYFL